MKDIINSLNLKLLIYINSHRSPFLDSIMFTLSSTEVWIPVYIYLLYIIFKEYKNKSWILMLTLAIMIILSDQLSTYLKILFKILRPSHESYLKTILYISKAGPGGLYGYVSSHASNFFSLLIFMLVLLPNKYNWFKYLFTLASLLVAYSRIYNGVHYPFDVLRGIMLGIIIGSIFSFMLKYRILNKSIFLKKN